MNTQSISINKNTLQSSEQSHRSEWVPEHLLKACTRWTVAIALALAVVVAGIWAATSPALHQYLSALLWGTGLIFFAIAIEANIRRAVSLVATGVALPTLAILGSRVAEEFSILATILLAAWLASWIGYFGATRKA